MKTLRILSMGLVVACFFLTTNVNAQATVEQWTDYTEFWCPCANDGVGEFLSGDITFHKVINGSVEHWNIKGGKLIGLTSGKTYTFTRVDNIKLLTGDMVIKIRTLGENGLTTYMQLVTNKGQVFYCR